MADRRQRQVGVPATEQGRATDRDDPLATALAVVPDDAVTDTEQHLNAPAVVRADRVRGTLSTLRAEAEFDRCACVTGQAYGDRDESIYHLRSDDNPTRELSVVVPVPATAPRSESGASVYPTADWHEREAYDLVGIEYDDHPDLRRILLPETWQGHPLGPDYDDTEPQIVTFREHQNPLADDHRDGDTLFVNMGPHHPATHGVLHLGVTLDGEHVADVTSDIGYIHRCEEQMCQQGTYRHQTVPYPDRWDWSGVGLRNEWAYARVAEGLGDVEVPGRAQVVRTRSAELSRMLGHFLAVTICALDVVGEFTAAFRYGVRDLNADGGTNLDAGMSEAHDMVSEYANDSERETCVVYVTDAMPNLGDTGGDSLESRLQSYADRDIHTTVVGVGVDFNSRLTETVSTVRGADYCAVDSPVQFEERMDEGFSYMVTPLVYNLSLRVASDEYSAVYLPTDRLRDSWDTADEIIDRVTAR